MNGDAGVVTLAVGQAGVQGAAALFQALAAETAVRSASGGDRLTAGAERFFYLASTGGGRARPTARAVLVDLEPKAVNAAQHSALAGSGGAWQFSRVAALTRAPGAANNWAAGALVHAPTVRDGVLGMLRRQAERCDRLAGVLVMQSAAGGTGSGLGSALTEALRDEMPAAPLLHHCIWPYECGEVAVAPYNCVLSLAALAEHSSGVMLTPNDELASACTQQLGVQRPGMEDLNAVAAHQLAALLLPSTRQQAPSAQLRSTTSGGGGGRGAAARGRGRGRPAWDAAPAAEHEPSRQAAPAGAWDGSFGGGSRWSDDEAPQRGGGSSSAGGPLDVFADVCVRLCATPGHRLLSLRTGPLLPPSQFDFTPFNWPVVLRDLRHAQLHSRGVQGGAASAPPAGAAGGRQPACSGGVSRRAGLGGGSGSGSGSTRGSNKALANLLIVRGDGSRTADASCFADPALYSSRGGGSLAVAASEQRLGGQQMLATALSNDQAAAAPVGRMLDRASLLFDARCYMHHYERHGLSCTDFHEALEAVEGVVERYRDL